jgi:hypothetical protein
VGVGYVRAHHLQLNGRQAPYRDSLVVRDSPELPFFAGLPGRLGDRTASVEVR